MQSKTFYLVHEDKQNLSTGWIKKIMVKCLSTFQRLRKILKSSIRWFKDSMSKINKKSNIDIN